MIFVSRGIRVQGHHGAIPGVSLNFSCSRTAFFRIDTRFQHGLTTFAAAWQKPCPGQQLASAASTGSMVVQYRRNPENRVGGGCISVQIFNLVVELH
jgi:hypothetical protein